jgi:rubrerythrin
VAKAKVDTTPVEHHWVCEDCGTCFAGVNPPDDCTYCHGKFFENLADLVEGKTPAAA